MKKNEMFYFTFFLLFVNQNKSIVIKGYVKTKLFQSKLYTFSLF